MVVILGISVCYAVDSGTITIRPGGNRLLPDILAQHRLNAIMRPYPYHRASPIHRTKKVFVLLPGQLDAIRRDISIEWADVEKEEVHP